MTKIIVKTGFGYITDDGQNIVAKYELPVGEHPLRDGFNFVEVTDRAALENIQVYNPPKTTEQIQNEKIQAKLREMAILELIKAGQWP